MRYLTTMAVLLVSPLISLAAEETGYEFPRGVPIKAEDVEWYHPTSEMQEGIRTTEPGNSFTFVGIHYFNQNWNREFPWRTGGLDRSDNAKTFKFHVKTDEELTVWMERSRFFTDATQIGSVKVKYPKDETFGELIRVNNKDVEVRLLVIQEDGEPKFFTYRPYKDLGDIRPYMVKEAYRVERLVNRHPGKVIDEKALVCDLEISEEGVDEILSRPFQDVTDVVFATTSETDTKSYGPTTTQYNGIVPRHTQAAFMSSKACLACHKTAGTEGRLIEPRPNPDKYGNIRGGGFVFSAPLQRWLRHRKVNWIDRPTPAERPISNMRTLN